jgi:hypothetical protein
MLKGWAAGHHDDPDLWSRGRPQPFSRGRPHSFLEAALSPLLEAALRPLLEAALSPLLEAALTPLLEAALSPSLEAYFNPRRPPLLPWEIRGLSTHHCLSASRSLWLFSFTLHDENRGYFCVAISER